MPKKLPWPKIKKKFIFQRSNTNFLYFLVIIFSKGHLGRMRKYEKQQFIFLFRQIFTCNFQCVLRVFHLNYPLRCSISPLVSQDLNFQDISFRFFLRCGACYWNGWTCCWVNLRSERCDLSGRPNEPNSESKTLLYRDNSDSRVWLAD